VKKPLFLSLFHLQKKTQTFSPIPLIVIKTFVPSTSSINHQKPKTKTLPQKQAKTTKTQKPFSWHLHSDPVRFYQLGKKEKKRKKKKLKTSQKTFDLEPFSPSKENSNF
jgi:hypothetical protein